MIALVTGGAGFIGSHLVERLIKEGLYVKVLDTQSTNIIESSNVEYITGDCSDINCLNKVIKNVDYIFHLAANPSVSLSIENPLPSNKNNLDSTLSLLEVCRNINIKRFIFSSTSAIYGLQEGISDESQCAKPISPYALQKYTSEQYCNFYNVYFNIPTVSLRYFNVFGPRQSFNSSYSGVISRFCNAIVNKHPVNIFGDGNQCRDFTYVSDIVEANIHAATSANVIGKTINIATGNSRTLNQVVSHLETITSTKIDINYHPARKGDLYTSKACIKLATSLDFKACVSFENGLSSTLNWYKKL